MGFGRDVLSVSLREYVWFTVSYTLFLGSCTLFLRSVHRRDFRYGFGRFATKLVRDSPGCSAVRADGFGSCFFFISVHSRLVTGFVLAAAGADCYVAFACMYEV